MSSRPQIRLGSLIVQVLDAQRFAVRDAADPAMTQILQESDVLELIEFLMQWSPSAQQKFRSNGGDASLRST